VLPPCLRGENQHYATSSLVSHAHTYTVFHIALRLLATLAVVFIISSPFDVRAQQPTPTQNAPTATPPALIRRTTRRETRRTNVGSTFTLYGAPVGNVTIEAWSRLETEITADIELRADTEDELAASPKSSTLLLTPKARRFASTHLARTTANTCGASREKTFRRNS
jgi:hypothetical protein